jgi:hypothetical protein
MLATACDKIKIVAASKLWWRQFCTGFNFSMTAKQMLQIAK